MKKLIFKMIKTHMIFISLIFFSTFFFAKLETGSKTGTEGVPISKSDAKDKKYIEFKVKGDKDKKFYLSVCADDDCDKRYQLVQSLKGNAKIFVDVNDCDEDTIFFMVDFYKGLDSNWTYEYNFCDEIKLTEGESINYYINKYDTEIIFSLGLKGGVSNIWARGQKSLNATINIAPVKQKQLGDYGYNYLVNLETPQDLTLKVVASKGDLINVGYMGYNFNYDANVKIQADGLPITGYLSVDTLDSICYSLDKEDREDNDLFIGRGVIFTKIGFSYIYYPDENKQSNETLHNKGFIQNALLFQKGDGKEQKICITFPSPMNYPQYNNIREIVFNYQLEKAVENKEPTLYEPQLNGVIYPRALRKSSKAIYNSQNNGEFKKMILNVMTSVGFTKMYVYRCDTFPLCKYDDTKMKERATELSNINRFNFYDQKYVENYDESPISKYQYLLVVDCNETERRSESESLPSYYDSICDFNTLIYKDDNTVELTEEENFYQYALQDEVNNYKIQIENEAYITKIFIDIIPYIGEIEFDSLDFRNKDLKYEISYAANKMSINIQINEVSENLEDILFSLKATTNTYYSILVTYTTSESDEDSFSSYILQTGTSYVVSIDDTADEEGTYLSKHIKFKNERNYDNMPYMVNFYSLNCKIDTIHIIDKNGKYTQISRSEDFAQEIIDSNDKDTYFSKEYEYRLSIESPDPSSYSGSSCKIYASSIEIADNGQQNARDILISENIPQQVKFENIKHITFGYTHVDYSKDILVKFNLKENAKYELKVYIENNQTNITETLVSSSILQIKTDEIQYFCSYCKNNPRVTYIKFVIDLVQIKDDGDTPIIEISVKSIDSNFVSYIPKNKLKLDYVSMSDYFYTEIGPNEDGYIIDTFLRGSGIFYARKVAIDTDKEEGANWRGKYRLPTESELTKADPYTKTMSFTTYSEECNSGCYLLIKMISNVNTIEKNTNYPYSLTVKSNQKNIENKELPAIKIQKDQYIIGTVDPSSQNNKQMSVFYTIWLDSDADHVVIDFQSNAAGMFINVGEEKPTTDKANFKIWPDGKENTYKLNKDDLVAESASLQGTILTIGIWTNMTGSTTTTPYSFAIRLDDEIEIYRVNSEHKVLCKSTMIGDKYKCVYIISDFKDDGIFIYASAQDKTTKCDIYGKYINAAQFEMSKDNEIIALIPSSSNFNFTNGDKDYLYVNQPKNKEDYLVVTVEIDKEEIIELLSTIPKYANEITLNPFTTQLFSTINDKSLIFDFPSSYMEMADILCAGGEGELYWNETDKYKIKGKDYRLSITSLRSGQDHKLTVNSKRINDYLVFTFEYKLRLDGVNFDNLNFKKAVDYVYLESDFPVTYFSPFYEFTNQIDYHDTYFTFQNLKSTKENVDICYENSPFIARGYIVDESEIYNKVLLPQKNIQDDENTIYGYYDHAVKNGIIRVTKDNIKNSKPLDYSKPYVYLKLDKSEQLKRSIDYKEIDLETLPTFSNSSIPISEASNLIGYLSSKQRISNYSLTNNSLDCNLTHLFLEFSCFEDSLDVKIDGKQINGQFKYGKNIYNIDTSNNNKDTLALTVERKNSSEESLQFFYYKYTFSNGTHISDSVYLQKQNLIINKTKEDGDRCDYNIKLVPVSLIGIKDYNVTYIVKLISDPNIPNKANLVLKLNTKYLKEFYNPILEEGQSMLSFDIKNVTNDITYIEVMVQIQIEEAIDYIAYDPQTDFTGRDTSDKDTTGSEDSESDDENGSGKSGLSKGTIAVIVIVCVVVVIIIVVIIIIVVYNKKKKKLRDKVEEISFAEADKKEDNEKKKKKDDNEEKEEKDEKDDKEVDDELLLNKEEDNN